MSCSRRRMHPEVAFNYLIRQLESDDTDDITLTIYYGGLRSHVHRNQAPDMVK